MRAHVTRRYGWSFHFNSGQDLDIYKYMLSVVPSIPSAYSRFGEHSQRIRNSFGCLFHLYSLEEQRQQELQGAKIQPIRNCSVCAGSYRRVEAIVLNFGMHLLTDVLFKYF